VVLLFACLAQSSLHPRWSKWNFAQPHARGIEIAFLIAAGTKVIASSPAPVAGTSGGVTNMISTGGGA
jgi:hypothetical protein